ncbi:hypothetical protein EC957_005827 [Mortierella hygrophila]|uniref:Uncharacterized protein n=1 Tax=Mortierella hygrophila TaxID=979708 RepID=A0A9P6JZA9_9FUNG|nr:hypothetical protein EC957_005827 [Mortierella hygrophila]
MRSLPVRRILPAHPLSLAHNHSPSSVRITSCSRPTIPTSQDSPWQLCFQRAYSRTVLSRDQPRRPTRPCSRQQHTSSGPTPSSTASPGLLSQKHQRNYSSAAAAAQPIPKETHGLISTTSDASKPIGGGATPKRESRSTKDLMTQLGQLLKDQNLSSALDIYLVVRRRTLPADQVESLFHFQRQLVQLFHFTTLQKSASDRAGVEQQFSKQLSLLDQRRDRVLRHISKRILAGGSHAEALAGLVDAIGKSRAMVQHSYVSNSSEKLQDWREALKVLEDWSAAEKPWDWKKNAKEGVVAKESGPASTNTPVWRNAVLERELGSWLVKLMSKLVYSHTHLVRSMLDTIPKQFGIKTTVDMHLVLLNYYAMFGRDGYRDTLSIVSGMDNKGISWKHETAVYDYLLYSLSHMSGNEAHADKIIEQMLANDLVPREETMKAAILCAARSGDLEACSRYISRMHEEWNLVIGERMKAILLYACAKRGDFDSAVEILGQLSVAGTLVRSRGKKRSSDNIVPTTSATTNAQLEEILSDADIINNTNVLLALINQTHNKRGKKKQMSQDFIKDEVSKVLELFTVITKNPQQIDTQLYTIMMQYLSTLPSPLPGMTYLYKEMQGTKNAKPNHVTYRIMLEACAEQMDMEYGKQLWDDMDESKIIKDCYVRASFVKGWGKIGYLKQAEWIAREGYLIQQGLDKERRQHRLAFVLKNQKRRDQGLPELQDLPRLPRRQRLNDIISLNVVHELMRSNRAHNKPDRVYEIYQEMEQGKWGSRIRPNQFTLSIVLQACGSGTATSKLVDQGIGLVERYIKSQQRQLQQFNGKDEDEQDEDSGSSSRAATDAVETISGKNSLASLSDVNYQLYFTMLGRHHRQHKMVTVWDEMMQVIERPPSHGTTNMVMEALENVQWGATPIKRIKKQLKDRWPQVDWDGAGRKKRILGFGSVEELVDEDKSVGAGGRFWR